MNKFSNPRLSNILLIAIPCLILFIGTIILGFGSPNISYFIPVIGTFMFLIAGILSIFWTRKGSNVALIVGSLIITWDVLGLAFQQIVGLVGSIGLLLALAYMAGVWRLKQNPVMHTPTQQLHS